MTCSYLPTEALQGMYTVYVCTYGRYEFASSHLIGFSFVSVVFIDS